VTSPPTPDSARLHYEHVIVTTTVASPATADTLAGLLLERRLAACVQISPIVSHYRWKGETAREEELLLTIKTRADRAFPIIEAIAEAHPYDEPEILVTPIVGGSAGYLRWVDDQVVD
jgi:periplasmic divalent cation tolerance protein